MKHLLTILLTLGASLALPNYLKNDEFSTGNNLFGADVLSELLEKVDGNILFSPFCAAVILALLQSGAKGETGEEIRSALRLPNTAEEADNLIKNVLPTIKSKYVTVEAANKVYVEEEFSIKESFEETVKNTYQAEVQNIEFKRAKEAAEEINEWVKEHTHDKINGIISPDSLNNETKVVLVNALYFQGNWSYGFYGKPVPSKFYTSAEASLDIAFMSSTVPVPLNYYESDELDAKILELPFEGEEATFTIALPNEVDGIGLLEKQLKTVFTTPKYSQEKLRVLLPRFKFDSTISFIDILKKLGIVKIFGNADFSGIADADLTVSAATQKTFIALEREGVEAAAATGVVITPGTVNPPDSKVFVVDHPFIFYIKFRDIVLFAGRVTDPHFDDDN